MKKIIFLLSIIFCFSCSNGLNKPIIETLSVDELKANIKKDTTFTDFYKDVQTLRSWILKSDVNQAQWGNITYNDLKKYKKKSSDTIFINKLTKTFKEEYKQLYPDYSSQVDSIMNYWREYKEQNKLEAYVKIEFAELWKEYYTYSGDVREVNVGFRITPLKGTIEQLDFRYDITSKISNSKTIGLYEGNRCLASSPIHSSKILYWEADYSDEKYLKNKTNTEIKRDYDFLIEIVEVRIDGENLNEKLEAIPHSVNMALKFCSEANNYYADDIIKELVDNTYKSFNDFASSKYDEALRKIDPNVYDFLEASQEKD